MSSINVDPIVHEDLEPIVVPVTFRTQSFFLREVDEGGAVKFNSARVSAARFSDGELDRVEKSAEVEPLLVSLCLFRKDAAGAEVSVPVETIKTWPARFVKKLYDKAMEISGLDDKLTLASIDKQIAKLTKKRAELVKGESGPKEPSSSTTDTSS